MGFGKLFRRFKVYKGSRGPKKQGKSMVCWRASEGAFYQAHEGGPEEDTFIRNFGGIKCGQAQFSGSWVSISASGLLGCKPRSSRNAHNCKLVGECSRITCNVELALQRTLARRQPPNPKTVKWLGQGLLGKRTVSGEQKGQFNTPHPSPTHKQG